MEDLFSQGIDRESIEQLREKLVSGGIPEAKIETILKTLEDQMPSTTPEEPMSPTLPGEPEQSQGLTFMEETEEQNMNTVKDVLKPGKSLMRPAMRICAQDTIKLDNEIEDVVEALMDAGMDPDTARHTAEQQILGADGMGILGQRERQGRAKEVMTFRDTVYDRLVDAIDQLGTVDVGAENDKILGEFNSDVTVAEAALDSAQAVITDLYTVVGNLVSAPDAEEAAKAEELLGVLEDKVIEAQSTVRNLAGGPDYEPGVDVEEAVALLVDTADEVKQVGLDTQQGTTSPIDLGDWLY